MDFSAGFSGAFSDTALWGDAGSVESPYLENRLALDRLSPVGVLSGLDGVFLESVEGRRGKSGRIDFPDSSEPPVVYSVSRVETEYVELTVLGSE